MWWWRGSRTPGARVRAAAAALLVAGSAARAHGASGANAATAATAAAATTIASWQVTPGYYSIGVRVFVHGDPDSNATVQLFARVHAGGVGGSAPYDSATTCFRRYGGGFDGVVLWCTPGRSYDVRADLRDPAGGVASVTTTTTTRSFATPVTGPLLYVAPPSAGGSDANAGTPARPKATIAAALSALFALPNEGRGGGVVLRPGIYPAGVTIQGGHATPDSLYHLMGDGSDPDSTIIDGSVSRTFAWSRYSRSRAPDSLYFVAGAGLDSCANLFRGWGHRLHDFPTRHALATDSTGLAEGFAFQKGATAERDTLFLKTLDGAAPRPDEVFHLGKRGEGIWVQRPYWHIAGLAIRFQGGGAYGNGIGVRLGAGNEAKRGSGCVLDSLHIYGTGTHAIHGTDGGQPSWCDTVLVHDCTLEGRGIERWPYPTCKYGNCEVCGIFAPGCAWGVFRNQVSGFFDGIDLDDFTGGGHSFISTDSTGGSDAEVAFNDVHDVADDGAELDGSAGINRRYLANTFRNDNFGLSLMPLTLGPNWIVGNTIVRAQQGGLKLGSIQRLASGRAALYHNTIAGTPGRFFVPLYHISGGFRRLRARNNVLVASQARSFVFRDLDTAADPEGRGSNDLDYDVMDTVGPVGGVWAWRNATLPLDAVRSKLGFERHGKVARVSFRDSGSTARDFELPAGGAAHASGVRIPGIDTPMFGITHFTGSAPDAGAWPLEHWDTSQR